MSFDARALCGSCGERSRLTFTFRNGFESCPGCQSAYRQQCAQNAKDEEKARRERDALAAKKASAAASKAKARGQEVQP